MVADKKPTAVDPPSPPANVDSRPGKVYSSEQLQSESRNLPPEVEHSAEYQRAKKSYGPSAHEVQWGPDVFQGYTDLNNPFYYRTPKGMTDTPAHVPQNPINLELHMRNERQRMVGMTNAEREWRKKYVKLQELHPDEPFFVEQAQFNLNPLRRLYRWPWDTFARKFLYPKFGLTRGHTIRQKVPKFILGFMIFEGIFYYVKYNQSDWEQFYRCSCYAPHQQFAHRDELEDLHPGLIEKAFPQYDPSNDFMDLGYKNRRKFLNLGESNRPW